MLNQEIIIPNSSPSEVYSVLTDSILHSKITGDEAIIDARVGGIYSAFSGYAVGEYTKLIENKIIEQTWRARDWPDSHYSIARFEISESAEGTKIIFTQENLPDGTLEEFKAGWQDNYWAPLQNYFSKQ